MKFLISILTIVALAKDCKNNPQAEAIQKNKDAIEITYVANTRGFYEYINISKEHILFSVDRDLKKVDKVACSKKDWDTILSLLSNIELAKISELEPPSKKFQFDGAAMATLELKTIKQQVKTPIFDHGNPPEIIAKLVAKVLVLKDKTQQN